MMKAYELYELAKRGYRLHDDFWTPDIIRSAGKYYMGNHLRMPDALVHDGEAMFKAGALRLPQAQVIFEYDTADQEFDRLALLCQQFEAESDSRIPGLIVSAPLMRRKASWSEFILAILFSFEGQIRVQLTDEAADPRDSDFRNQLQSIAYALTLGAIAALRPGVSRVELVETQSRMHRKGATKEGPPCISHYVVTAGRTDN